MARIYLDACVFISYTKEEFGWNIRGLFVEAQRFFGLVAQKKHTIVLSGFFFHEVENVARVKRADVIQMLEKIGVQMELIPETDRLHISPYTSLGVPREDAMHVALACIAKCDMIVTFNIKDFRPAEKYISIREPSTLT
jgi:predicted nucleic acid-binding protein